MFRNALAIVEKFTFPVLLSRKTVGGACEGSIGTFIVVNRDGRNKDGLLRVLERPEIPINTNTSENDIRAFVTKRKISGGTVSDKGRATRATSCWGLPKPA
jgi:hypothetical protein